MENEKNLFTYVDSVHNEHTIEIKEGDFKLVQSDIKLHDEAMQSKPTTFFKDALRRFAKNKSSIVGAVVLGVILLSAIFVPVISQADISATSVANAYQTKLYPKLFEAGTGWWDGCRDMSDITIDLDWETYDATGGETKTGLPAGIKEAEVAGGKDAVNVTEIVTTDAVNTYAHGGFVRISTSNATGATMLSGSGFNFDFFTDCGYNVEFITSSIEGSGYAADWKYGEIAPYSLTFVWDDMENPTAKHKIVLVEETSDYGTKTASLYSHIDEIKAVQGDNLALGAIPQPDGTTKSLNPHFEIFVRGESGTTRNLLVKSLKITSNVPGDAAYLRKLSIYDANETLSIEPTIGDTGVSNPFFWITRNGQPNLFKALLAKGSYRLDTYVQALGDYFKKDMGYANLIEWKSRGWIDANLELISSDAVKGKTPAQLQEIADAFAPTFKILNEERCPLKVDENFSIGVDSTAVVVRGTVTRWRELFLDRTSMPKYIMGTDNYGRDMLKYTFSGLRTSLLLGVITAAINFSFGLVWGAISGYFGGWTDILMERFTDILGGIPWIVMMTLLIVLYGSNFLVFAVALCITGWIGTSHLVRTQFYRFKNREYILAARTLGASDFRLIFRHILPNAIGTIVTSSVLMVPSVIFSEATISYLNLGLKGMDSFGVILSDNQQFIQNYPFLILFPSAVMALMMISFNLFGNGLRDALNPSLKGEE